ncbi:MAG: DMT family transporter [Candidatus Shapirobacteria bacterium]|nr:DMT family transporter [Candidatus Shapirobacteria bacterium]
MNKGYFFVLTAVLIWAISSGVLIKNITISPFAFYSIGAFFGVIFLLINLIVNKKINDFLKIPRKTFVLMLLVGLGTGINNGLFFTALKSGSVANAALTHNLAPVFVVFLFAPLFLKEKLTLKKIILVSISFLGLFILSIPTFKKSLDLALLYGSLSAVFYAFHVVIEKKVTQLNADPIIAAVYKNFVPLFIFSPFAVNSIRSGISFSNWFWVTVWGVFVLGVSFVLFFNGIKKISATSASILTYGEPVGAIILAFIFFKQPIDLYTILGGLLIILSGILVMNTKPPEIQGV